MSAIIVQRYKLEEPLGRGAFGQVFLALDVLSGQHVALKRFFETAHDRWREATALRALNLPGVVRLLDEGLHQGAPFIVTELVRDGQRFPGPHTQPQALLELTLRLLEIVENIHAHGLIHGDLKPTNVLIDDQGQPMILDLGLARPSFTSDQELHRLEGSPRYMAPELFRQEPPRPASDLYAIGVMAFEAACGRPPHRGESIMELLRARLLDPCPSLRELAPHCPDALIELVDALLANEPEQRRRPTLLSDAPRQQPHLALDISAPQAALISKLTERACVQLLGVKGCGRTWLIERALESEQLKSRRAVWLGPDATIEELTIALDAQASPDHRTFDELKAALTDAARRQPELIIVFRAPPATLMMRLLVALGEHLCVIIRHSEELLWPSSTLHLSPQTPERLAALFHGPELGFHLSSRAAWQLYLRTAGLPARIIETLATWRRHGLCAMHQGRDRLSLRAVEALERGWHIPAHSPQPHAKQSPQAQAILELLSLGQGCLTHDELVMLLERPSWEITALTYELASQGALVVDGERYVSLQYSPRPLERPPSAQLMSQAKHMSQRMPITHPCQLTLLELEDDPELLTERAHALAQALDMSGHITKATHILSRTCARLRHLGGAPSHHERLLTQWAKIALSTHTAPSIEEVLYPCVRHQEDHPSAQELQPLITLLEAARIACRTRNQAALDHIEAIPAFEDMTLELRRQMYRGYLSFAMTEGALDQVIEEVEAWVQAHGDQEARATLIGWRGWQAYSKNDFAQAAQHHREAAQLKSRTSAKLASTLAAISAMMENFELEDALQLAHQALQLAASIGHTNYELQAAHFIQQLKYRLANDEITDFDFELLAAISESSLKDLVAATHFCIGFKYIRQENEVNARPHIEKSVELWRISEREHLEILATALLNIIDKDFEKAKNTNMRNNNLKDCHAKNQTNIILKNLSKTTQNNIKSLERIH